LKFVWEAAPAIVVGDLASRVAAALVPLGALIITRHIIDHIVALRSDQTPLPHIFWWLVAAEFGLAVFAAMLMRVVDFCDTALAERFMRHISVRLMKHAANLDLMSYEDPIFYDKLERARVQSTDRVQMIKIGGRLVQEVVTTVSLAAGILFYAPMVAACAVYLRGTRIFG
jgi:ATP-binding cassette subfamily B protein